MGESIFRVDAPVGTKDVGRCVGQLAGETRAPPKMEEAGLDSGAQKVFLQFAKKIFFAFVSMVHITQLRIGDDKAVCGIDDIEWFLAALE